MGRPASPDYWWQWRAAHPAYAGAGRREVGTCRRPAPRRARAASAPDVGTGPRHGPRPRGWPSAPVGRALRSWLAPPPGLRAATLVALAPPPRAIARGRLMVDGSLPRLCLPGLRAPRRRLRLAHDERASLRPLWPTRLRQPLPAHARPSDPADERLATPREADGRGARRPVRLALPRLAPRAALGPTRRAHGRPSGGARPRWRAAARSARRAVLDLQRAQGLEPAAAVRQRHPHAADVDDRVHVWVTTTTPRM